MRDLSQIAVGNVPRPRTSKKLFRLLVIVIVIIGVLFLVKSRLGGGGSSAAGVLLHDAPYGLKPVAVSGESTKIAEGGTNLTTQAATLKDVKFGGEAQATASRSFGGGTYILSVNATLPDPVNVNYAVWLVGGGPARLIDYMKGSGTSWSLTLRDTDKYSDYSGIWITLERTKDAKPEEHVMEGSF